MVSRLLILDGGKADWAQGMKRTGRMKERDRPLSNHVILNAVKNPLIINNSISGGILRFAQSDNFETAAFSYHYII